MSVLLSLIGGTLTLRGRVLRRDGSAWRGHVRVTRAVGPDAPWTTGDLTPTDADGGFEVGGLPPLPVRVVAVEAGRFRLAWPPVSLPHPDELVLVVDDGVRQLSGVVVRSTDEAPLGGVTVEARTRADDAIFEARTTTGTDGRFRLEALASRARVRARAPGHATATVRPAPEEADVRIVLSACGRLGGRVVECASRKPVPGARVVLIADEGVVPVWSDEEGRFDFGDVAPGRHFVGVLGGGWSAVDLAEHRDGAHNALVRPQERTEIEVGSSPRLGFAVACWTRAGWG